MVTTDDRIEIRGACEHNLKHVDVDVIHGQIIAITGVSGSGKSSLAFDTVYAEARRRFLLSAGGGAALFADRLQPPRVDRIDGLRPALAIAQARHRPSARSTAGTVTGIADFLRLLFARVGRAHCLGCGEPVEVHRFEEVSERAARHPDGTRLVILAPLRTPTDGDSARACLDHVERSGFRRLRIGGATQLLEDVDVHDVIGKALEVVVDRVVVKLDSRRRLRGSLQAAAQAGEGAVVLLDHDSGVEERFSLRPGCSRCGAAFPEITPALFSFNSPTGACSDCRGTGFSAEAAFSGLLTIGESPTLALAPLWERFGHRKFRKDLEAFYKRLQVDGMAPLADWPPAAQNALWEGEGRRKGAPFVGLRRWLSARLGRTQDSGEASWLEDLVGDGGAVECSACAGRRLSPAALAVQIDGDNIADLMARPVVDAAKRIAALQVPEEGRELADHILRSVRQALATFVELGLGYLALDRRAHSLSAGELQRLHLVAALGSGLSQVLYVLDEPSAGLHPRDTDRLGTALQRLRDGGNTVLLVEHDLALICGAESVVELGPAAGAQGGEIVASGTPEQIFAAETATGRALRRVDEEDPSRGRTPGVGGWLKLIGAAGHNLKGIDVAIPLRCLVCVSGVSGSGKSSLVHDTLHPLLSDRLQRGERRPLAFDAIKGVDLLQRVVAVDQAPIGRSARSNAATYTGLMAALRELFVELPEAKLRGYRAGHFSFNSLGACSACAGSGCDPEAAGFEDLPVPCPSCSGSRYNREVLEIRFRGHSIDDVLSCSVTEALEFFANVPAAAQRLRLLADLGLGYLRLGQPASSLSGGEAQRVKLAAELSRPLRERTLYILDEPTAGLHHQDVGYLLELLQRLVDRDNTVLVVEHDLAVIAAADHVIDLGPEAGQAGGEVVVVGAPVTIAACAESHTGRHLAAYLAGANRTGKD
ncbi:MAG TPA: excinuclease ABC subunit A [Candidatus Latescibacteria bacterium]|nr:excinuclease ABC subunit A [Candidatus Latescibacterota bacterium]